MADFSQFMAPDIYAQQQELNRKKQLAEALRMQGMQNINQDVIDAGALKVARSPLEGISNLAMAYMGNKRVEEAGRESDDLNKKLIDVLRGGFEKKPLKIEGDFSPEERQVIEAEYYANAPEGDMVLPGMTGEKAWKLFTMNPEGYQKALMSQFGSSDQFYGNQLVRKPDGTWVALQFNRAGGVSEIPVGGSPTSVVTGGVDASALKAINDQRIQMGQQPIEYDQPAMDLSQPMAQPSTQTPVIGEMPQTTPVPTIATPTPSAVIPSTANIKAQEKTEEMSAEDIQKAKQSIGTLKITTDKISKDIDNLISSPGLSEALGKDSYLYPAYRGSAKADWIASKNSIAANAMKLGKDMMADKGAVGTMTVQEWPLMQSIVTDLSNAQSEEQFKKSALELKQLFKRIYENVSKKAGAAPTRTESDFMKYMEQ